MWPFKKRKRSSIEEFSKDSFDSAMRFEKSAGLGDNLKYTPMVVPMTIDEILREAFKKIHDEHRVALRYVSFDHICADDTLGQVRFCERVQIEADTLTGPPYKK